MSRCFKVGNQGGGSFALPLLVKEGVEGMLHGPVGTSMIPVQLCISYLAPTSKGWLNEGRLFSLVLSVADYVSDSRHGLFQLTLTSVLS